MMLRFRTLTIGLLALAAARTQAQDAAPASVQDELRALRQLVELQSKKIDVLSAQVTRLSAQLNGGAAAAAHDPAAHAEAPVAKPVAPPANVHIVVKGDSLEKIAKTHGIAVADLLKLNKITDPKRIQIGQQIALPPKPADPAKPGEAH